MHLRPGLRIAENLELRFLIGEGGMGQVWAADHVLLRRQVAVKFVSEWLAENSAALARFETEAQTLARLRSEYAPEIFDYARLPDGTPFMVMELLGGCDLQTQLRTEGPLSIEQTERLVRQVGAVLKDAHALGIVHRDIKPENIILIPEDEGTAGFTAKVLDFGIAKATPDARSGGLTRTGTTLGTPSYMSPEQLLGAKDVDGRADLWSLAVVAYCALTGVTPFAGDTFGAVCLSIHRGDWVDASERRPGLPRALDGWFRKALNPRYDKRYASSDELVAAFVEASRRARSPVPREGWGGPVARSLAVAGAVAMAVGGYASAPWGPVDEAKVAQEVKWAYRDVSASIMDLAHVVREAWAPRILRPAAEPPEDIPGDPVAQDEDAGPLSQDESGALTEPLKGASATGDPSHPWSSDPVACEEHGRQPCR